MIRISAVLFLLLATSAAATPLSPARERTYYSPAYVRCLDITHGVRPREHCTAQEIGHQRSALDARYNRLLVTLHGHARARLSASEQSWEDRMQAHCTVFSRRRGSLNSVKAQDCFLSATIDRRAELQHMR